jgi:hypothetical protein
VSLSEQTANDEQLAELTRWLGGFLIEYLRASASRDPSAPMHAARQLISFIDELSSIGRSLTNKEISQITFDVIYGTRSVIPQNLTGPRRQKVENWVICDALRVVAEGLASDPAAKGRQSQRRDSLVQHARDLADWQKNPW